MYIVKTSNIYGREDEDLWNQGRKALQRTTPRSAPILSAPKTDLYVALPILPKTSKPRGFYNDDFIQNFHETRLARLCEKGLISCPIADLSGLKRLDHKQLLCFPSAVIEVKHHKVKPSEERMCYCQAANASSSALAMLSKLSAYPHGSPSPQMVRPVVSFTFIGPQAKVWVTYINSREKKDGRLLCKYVSKHFLPHRSFQVPIWGFSADTWQKMHCIWRGDLRKVWDSMQLCCIIKHLHYWTLRHFRPWVSSCLDQWCLEHNITGLREFSDTEANKDKDDLSSNDEESEEGDDDESEEEEDEESEREEDKESKEKEDEAENKKSNEGEKEEEDEIEKEEKVKQEEGGQQEEVGKQEEGGKQEVNKAKARRASKDLENRGVGESLMNNSSGEGQSKKTWLDSPTPATRRGIFGSIVECSRTVATTTSSEAEELESHDARLNLNSSAAKFGLFGSTSSSQTTPMTPSPARKPKVRLPQSSKSTSAIPSRNQTSSSHSESVVDTSVSSLSVISSKDPHSGYSFVFSSMPSH